MNRFKQNTLAARVRHFGRRFTIAFAAMHGAVAVVALGVVTATLSSSLPAEAKQSAAPLPACVLPKQPKGVCMSKLGKAEWEQAHHCSFCAVTMGELKKALPNASPATRKALFDDMNGHLIEYGLDSPNRLWQFFAQVRVETGGGSKLVENLTYAASILPKKFKYFKSHPAEACKFGYIKKYDSQEIKKCKLLDQKDKNPEIWTPHGANQEAIANRAYAKKNGNGDVASGDGWKYRGRGMLQVTGKGNYKNEQVWYNEEYKPKPPISFIKHPELLKKPDYAFKASAAFWLGNGIEADADKTDSANVCTASDTITKKVNGGGASKATKKRRCDALKDIIKNGVFAEVDCHLPAVPPPSSKPDISPSPHAPRLQRLSTQGRRPRLYLS